MYNKISYKTFHNEQTVLNILLEDFMDRRQKRTREAILKAFTQLLSKYNYNQISVQQIIDTANIGRTTFYSHYETKESLLEDLCTELFGHIIDTAKGIPHGNYQFNCGISSDSVFLHLLWHLQENDYNILELLSSQNNEIFIQHFKDNLQKLIQLQYAEKGLLKKAKLPEDFLVHHIASSFVNTVSWWISNKMKESPEKITEYFLTTIEGLV